MIKHLNESALRLEHDLTLQRAKIFDLEQIVRL